MGARARSSSLAAVAAAALLAACGGTSAEQPRPAAAEPASVEVARATAPARTCRPGGERRLGDRGVAYAAEAPRGAVAFRSPGGARVRAFGPRNVNGYPTVFGVLGEVLGDECEATWYRVQLPIRPNGASGYVRAADVVLHRVRTRIEVDVSERRIVFLRDGRRVLAATAAVGSAATPTPLGRYYVNQRLRPADPDGPFGPAAIGISAFSPVLTGWAQGGPIAIHGTNDPGSVGRPVSNGCLRLPNDTLERLFGAVPAGTPVVIRA